MGEVGSVVVDLGYAVEDQISRLILKTYGYSPPGISLTAGADAVGKGGLLPAGIMRRGLIGAIFCGNQQVSGLLQHHERAVGHTGGVFTTYFRVMISTAVDKAT